MAAGLPDMYFDLIKRTVSAFAGMVLIYVINITIAAGRGRESI